MKRKVEIRRTGEKSRKCITSTLQGLSHRKFFLPCSGLALYFSQKGYFLLAPLREIPAYVTPGLFLALCAGSEGSVQSQQIVAPLPWQGVGQKRRLLF
jgi:hypothetical protein